jgi:hypothetical protein
MRGSIDLHTQITLPLHGLYGIGKEINKDLFQLAGISLDHDLLR